MHFPASTPPDPKASSPAVHDPQRDNQISQAALPRYIATAREIRRRTETLIGRERELDDVASFASGTEGYRWIVAPAYAGKTSLLAEAAFMLRERADTVSYFLSRREADADSSRFLAAVVPQLAYILQETVTAADVHQFRDLWEKAAQQANATACHLVLIVDGLDEDLRPQGMPSVCALLPALVGGAVHVLVSSRPHPELPSDLPATHPLRQARSVTLKPFQASQLHAGLARQEIDDLIRRDDGLAADIFGLLTAAAGPLTVEDLTVLTEAKKSPGEIEARNTQTSCRRGSAQPPASELQRADSISVRSRLLARIRPREPGPQRSGIYGQDQMLGRLVANCWLARRRQEWARAASQST